MKAAVAHDASGIHGTVVAHIRGLIVSKDVATNGRGRCFLLKLLYEPTMTMARGEMEIIKVNRYRASASIQIHTHIYIYIYSKYARGICRYNTSIHIHKAIADM